MEKYTNDMRPLVLPEYGRNIQNMVDYCCTLEDREQRNLCARTIVDAMRALVPSQGDREEHNRKLWDHLMIMSNFSLDIDSPYEYVHPEVFADRPGPIPLALPSNFPFRHYGLLTHRLIEEACAMEPGEEREALIMLTANHMKKTLLAENKDFYDDGRICNDINILSKGRIYLDPNTTRLNDYKHAPTPSGRSNNKKKKK